MGNRSKSSSTSTATAQRATTACQSCRQRKVKCDAQFVAPNTKCGPCERAGQDCLVDPSSDGRRTISRKLVDKLQQRIETLESIAQRPPESSIWIADDDRVTLVVDETISSDVQSDLPPPESPSLQSPRQSHSSSTPRPPCTSSAGRDLPALTSCHDISPRTVRQRSPSFYGATSHPHVTSPGGQCDATQPEGFDFVGISLDPSSSHLQHQLLESFFKYQTLWVDVVNREMFLSHRKKGQDSRWYSEFLENVMLACGTRLSTSQTIRALGLTYCEKAKAHALTAMSEPTPANLQGFLLLSEYEVTKGNDRPGWMYCGVACRMLSDLGLHELANSDDLIQTSTVPSESDLAYALLSACIVYEGVWTLYLGRPSSIPRSLMTMVAQRCKANEAADSVWLNAWVGLCIPMAEASHILNEHSLDKRERNSSLRKLMEGVEGWYGSLPPDLVYNEERLSNLNLAGYGLHTQYCKLQILLRQALGNPLDSRKRRYSEITTDERISQARSETDVATHRYALRIARLVVTYREVFGMEKIPSIVLDNAVVAATAMIKHLSDANHTNHARQEIMWLQQLLRSLESLQPHFPIVKRMIDSLQGMCKTSLLPDLFPSSRQDLTDTALSLVPNSHQAHLPADNIHHEAVPGNDTTDAWSYFDSLAATGDLPSIGVNDFFFHLPTAENLLSNMPQQVP